MALRRALGRALGIALLTAAAASAQPLTQTFRSAPSLRAPILSFSGSVPDVSAGDIFVDAQNSLQAGPMIISPHGQLIWFDPLPNDGVARNVEVQRYRGRSVLTFWQGFGHAFGVGHDVLLDHSYQMITTVQGANGYTADTHAFQITPQGTALIAAYAAVPADLSSVGGPRKGTLVNGAVQEIDIATGALRWQWSTRDHIPLSASYAGRPGRGAYDAYHLNSVQQLANGNVLVSVRNTWALYELDKQTGRIVWTLGGKHSTFRLGPGAGFEWQHDGAMLPDGTITVFDDGAALTPHGLIKDEPQSRGLRIHLDLEARTATLLRAYTNSPPLLSQSQGSVQALSDGNTFVGWGSQPYFTEFGRDGSQLFSIHFPTPLQSYRAFRYPWWGQPPVRPAIAVARTRSGTRVYASWNGTTGIASWRVLAAPSATAPGSAVGQFKRTSFETSMWVPSTQPFVAVQALGGDGHVLGTSAAVAR